MAGQRCTDDLRGVDFDDPEYGFKEEDKDPVKVCARVVSYGNSGPQAIRP